MNKKFFSAVLMGALLLGGTFVSCQDYDDDIENLQNQIDKLASADQLSAKVSELQGLISTAQSAASGAQSAADAAKKSAGDADAKAVAAQKAADDLKAAAAKDYATKEEAAAAKAAADAAQKVADEAMLAAAAGLTAEDVDAAVAKAVEGFATVEALQEVADQLAAIQEAIEKCASADDLADLAEKVAALEGKVPGASAVTGITSAVAPVQVVDVRFEWAKWEPDAANPVFKKLLAQFPEIANIPQKSMVTQGGHLPVLVNPSEIDLTEGYTFALVNEYGEVQNVAVKNPRKGVEGEVSIDENGFWNKTYTFTADTLYSGLGSGTAASATVYDEATSAADTIWVVSTVKEHLEWVGFGSYTMTTRAANDCYWTLDIDPEMVWGSYANSGIGTPAALAITSADGSVVKTAFAYKVSSDNCGQVKISTSSIIRYNGSDYYDLLQGTWNGAWSAPAVSFTNEKIGYYIIELAEPLQVESYKLAIAEDGHTLYIGNMPASSLSIPVKLKVTALGLNGSVAQSTYTVNVMQNISAAGAFSDKNVTLKKDDQNVLWNLSELKLTATQLNQLYNARTLMTVSVFDSYNNQVLYVNETNTAVPPVHRFTNNNSGVYSNYAQVGLTLKSEYFKPGTYTVTFEYKSDVNTVVYKVSAKMIVANPTTADLFSLATAYTEGDVLTVVGRYDDPSHPTDTITYVLENGVVAPEVATFVKFEDLDYINAVKNYQNETNWIVIDPAVTTTETDTFKLAVPKWVDNNSSKQKLYKERTIRGTYYLFKNEANKVTYDFKVMVKSAIWNADPTKAVKVDDTKLTTVFGTADTLDVRPALTGIFAAGINKGKEYAVFGGTMDVTYYNYFRPDTVKYNRKNYVVSNKGTFVALDLEDLSTLGYGPADIMKIQTTKDTIEYLTYEKWQSFVKSTSFMLVAGTSKYFDVVNSTGWKRNGTPVEAADQEAYDVFMKYAVKFAYTNKNESNKTTVTETAASATPEIASTKFEFANVNEAKKYLEKTDRIVDGKIMPNPDIRKANLGDKGYATVDVKLTIKDKWGRSMTRTFTVKITAPD